MQLTMSKTREQFPLSYKKIWKKTITGIFGWIPFSVFLVVLGIYFARWGESDAARWLVTSGIFFGLLSCLLTYFFQRWYFATYFYNFTPDFIIIRKGPITPHEITIPYERIQDVYVDQDFYDRLFGMYDVHVSSATVSSDMEAHIDGLEKNAAEGLRAQLLEAVRSRVSKK